MDPGDTNWQGTASDVRTRLKRIAERWIGKRDHTKKNTAPSQDHQDAVQEVLMRMLMLYTSDGKNANDVILHPKTNEPMFPTSEALESYVKRSVRHEMNQSNKKAKNHLRRQSIGGDDNQPPYEQLQARPEFDDSVQRERLAIIQPCLDKLTPRSRRVLIAVDNEGEAKKSVANRENITGDNWENTLNQILSRARSDVRDCVAAHVNTQDLGLI